MRTNIDIDEKLIADAMVALGTKTKKATVEAALKRVGLEARAERLRYLRGMGWEGDLDAWRRDSEDLREWTLDDAGGEEKLNAA